jgi:hypothetical protein
MKKFSTTGNWITLLKCKHKFQNDLQIGQPDSGGGTWYFDGVVIELEGEAFNLNLQRDEVWHPISALHRVQEHVTKLWLKEEAHSIYQLTLSSDDMHQSIYQIIN